MMSPTGAETKRGQTGAHGAGTITSLPVAETKKCCQWSLHWELWINGCLIVNICQPRRSCGKPRLTVMWQGGRPLESVRKCSFLWHPWPFWFVTVRKCSIFGIPCHWYVSPSRNVRFCGILGHLGVSALGNVISLAFLAIGMWACPEMSFMGHFWPFWCIIVSKCYIFGIPGHGFLSLRGNVIRGHSWPFFPGMGVYLLSDYCSWALCVKSNYLP